MKVFYHNDLDGLCSAAIVKHAYPEIPLENFMEINYGWPFPWDIIKPGERVWMVDFCLQPFSDMNRLNRKAPLVWIDHHKTALEEYQKYLDDDYIHIDGLRKIGQAGCELTWQYCFKDEDVPRVVHLLGRYDVWDLYSPEVLQFQMGMRFKDFSLDHQFWNIVLDIDSPEEYKQGIINDTIEIGQTIIQWEDVRAKEYCKAYGIETFLNGYRAMALNIGRSNSQFFQAGFDKENYDIFIYFCRLPSRKWTVGLIANNDYVDVGEIAKSFGGGGHKSASGFTTDSLPFEI